MSQTDEGLRVAAEHLSRQLADLFEYAGSPVSDDKAASAMVVAMRLIVDADAADWGAAPTDASLVVFRDLLTHAARLSRARLDGSASVSEWAAAATALAAWSKEDRPGLA